MPRRESEVEAPSNNREVTKDEYIHWIGIYLLLRADFVVPMSCCVRVSVYDVSVTMDLLQGVGMLAPRPIPKLGEQVLYSSGPTPGTCPARLDQTGTELRTMDKEE